MKDPICMASCITYFITVKLLIILIVSYNLYKHIPEVLNNTYAFLIVGTFHCLITTDPDKILEGNDLSQGMQSWLALLIWFTLGLMIMLTLNLESLPNFIE